MKKDKILKQIDKLKATALNEGIDLSGEVNRLKNLVQTEDEDGIKEKNAQIVWGIVQKSRKIERAKPQDFINNIIINFIEFKGDRAVGDDAAIMGGVGYINDICVTVIAIRRGHTLNENIEFNFGMPHPEGYRKALRLMKQAEKFRRPIITFVDTPGAYPGIDSEERGMALAIAENLYYMSDLKTPIVTVITGEGGSGGALALTVSDYIIMMQNAILSVITPEGCASILFKDSTKAGEAAASLKLTANDLKELGLIDVVIDEGQGLDIKPEVGYENVKNEIIKSLKYLMSLSIKELTEFRYQKFRKIGFFKDTTGLIKKSLKKPKNFIYELFKL